MANDALAGAAVYSRQVLRIYDLFVLGFSNRVAWRCPSPDILAFYDEHISNNHLDVGVGTGFFLDRCRFPTATPAITLLDLNRNSLEATAQRLRRYRPRVVEGNVLEPWSLEPSGFDSIGMSYLLHCLPGTMQEKAVVFQHLKPWLNPGGVLFGTTILGKGIRHNLLARFLLKIYNRRGIFSNRQDDSATLEEILQANFGQYRIEKITGCVAFFTAREV